MKLSIEPDVIIPTIARYWDFSQLCHDLAIHKGSPLSHREKQFLAYLLLGYGPKDIREQYRRESKSSGTRTTLSRTLYPLLKQFLAQHTQEVVKPGSSGRLVIILEQLGYKKALLTAA
jgi:hypothetical protein